VRWSAANAYLRPILRKRRKHLKTENKAFITRILFEGNKAVGVEYHKDNQVHDDDDDDGDDLMVVFMQ